MAKDSREILFENINLLREMSSYNEDDDKLDRGDINSIVNDPDFSKQMGDMIKDISFEVAKNSVSHGKKVGDSDGILEPTGNLTNQDGQPQQETYDVDKLHEAGLAMLAAGSVLASPKMIEMIGKSISQLGMKKDMNFIQIFGDRITDVAHKIHNTYHGSVVNLLKSTIGRYVDKSDEYYDTVALGILTTATLLLGIASASAVGGAVGNIGGAYAATGSALGAKAAALKYGGVATVEALMAKIKGGEVLANSKKLIPRILNGFFK